MTESTSTQIQTSGGTYIGGNVETGRDFVARDQYNYGSSPAEFAAMLTRLFGLMVEIPQARNVLLGARTILENSRLQLRRLTEYKEAHDLLQQLESSYLVVYTLIYDEGAILPLEQIRWHSLDRSCFDLQSSMQRVCTAIARTSLANDVADWHTRLLRGVDELQVAYRNRDLDLFDIILDEINRIINTQTPRMNDRLIGAVDGLQLADLVLRLTQMQQELAQSHVVLASHQTVRLSHFAADITDLSQIAAQLFGLRNAHDHWQQADNELRTDYIPGSPSNALPSPSGDDGYCPNNCYSRGCPGLCWLLCEGCSKSSNVEAVIPCEGINCDLKDERTGCELSEGR